MFSFRYATPEWVHSGAGSLRQLPAAVERLHGSRVFIPTTRSLREALRDVEVLLGDVHAGTYAQCSQHSPAATVDAAVALAEGADVLISFGGGSVIDTAKAVAHQTGAPPHIAIPTTLSAGEFTAAAGITDEARRYKRLIAHRNLQPRVIIHDPQLTLATPRELWLSTGMKALDHAFEGLWAIHAHPVTDLTATDAARRLLRFLPDSIAGQDLEPRHQCQLAAWLSIIGMTNAGTRLSHPVGHQIGAFWNVPHGVTSCITLPVVIQALDDHTSAVRDKIAPLFGVSTAAAAADALREQLAQWQLPQRLRDTSAVQAEIPKVAAAVNAEFQHMGREPDANVEQLLHAMW